MNKDIEALLGIMKIGNGKRDRNHLIRDFFEMLAIRISNTCDPVHLSARQQQLTLLMSKYNHEELLQFEHYVACLTDIMQRNVKEQNLEDILGRLFERHDHLIKGQELTPQSIADLMSHITIQPEIIEKNGYITVYDPTCGSGGTYLATAQRVLELGYNPIANMVVLANDVNARAVHMAYIQTSLYGIPAVITQADIFTLKEVTRWYTPAYILGKWVWRHSVGHTSGRNKDDELLKMITDPMYAAIRHMQGWFKEDSDNENS